MSKIYVAANYVTTSGYWDFLVPDALEDSGHLQIVEETDGGAFNELEVQAPGAATGFGSIRGAWVCVMCESILAANLAAI
ncbi:hypothetical protein E2A64_09720 [Pseudohoeflea suaedae]|uniref:Uncharacterized protein n=1 Tax=Pseudohoeflea suaedae TaxID=877384 RepID=A0A4V3A7N4_9HYPH|nr:hypothetical protein [Pseudohoeflea suaedae]TDH39315.1 hypothetical protein E2A64_09720 [Pseudohoeflea suaedae]